MRSCFGRMGVTVLTAKNPFLSLPRHPWLATTAIPQARGASIVRAGSPAARGGSEQGHDDRERAERPPGARVGPAATCARCLGAGPSWPLATAAGRAGIARTPGRITTRVASRRISRENPTAFQQTRPDGRHQARAPANHDRQRPPQRCPASSATAEDGEDGGKVRRVPRPGRLGQCQARPQTSAPQREATLGDAGRCTTQGIVSRRLQFVEINCSYFDTITEGPFEDVHLRRDGHQTLRMSGGDASSSSATAEQRRRRSAPGDERLRAPLRRKTHQRFRSWSVPSRKTRTRPPWRPSWTASAWGAAQEVGEHLGLAGLGFGAERRFLA